MDLQLIETGNGGDLIQKGSDLSQIFGFENMVYLALFGGNVEMDTPVSLLPGQQNFSYWGNNIFALNNPKIQFNSQTERALKNTALTSSGRVTIQNAVNADLAFMKAFADITVTVTIIATNVVEIDITIKQPDNQNSTQYIFIWDSSLQELQGASNYFTNTSGIQQDGFQYLLPIYL